MLVEKNNKLEILDKNLPFFSLLSAEEKGFIDRNSVIKSVEKGCLLQTSSSDCLGLVVLLSGRIRVYITSFEGKELTIYHLNKGGICLFSASCVFNNVSFDIDAEAEDDCTLLLISSSAYKQLMSTSITVSNYTNELMASKFSAVMWLLEQVTNKKVDKKLASALYEQSIQLNSNIIKTTHEEIGKLIGSPREVVTRMLQYFQEEKIVELSRGKVTIIDFEKLKKVM